MPKAVKVKMDVEGEVEKFWNDAIEKGWGEGPHEEFKDDLDTNPCVALKKFARGEYSEEDKVPEASLTAVNTSIELYVCNENKENNPVYGPVLKLKSRPSKDMDHYDDAKRARIRAGESVPDKSSDLGESVFKGKQKKSEPETVFLYPPTCC